MFAFKGEHFFVYHGYDGYAKFYSRSQPGEVRVFDGAGGVVSVESWTGDFKET